MVNEVVRLSRLENNDQIAVVCLNRPEYYNSLTAEILDGLTLAAQKISEDAQIRAVILTGEGRFFSSGADFSLFEAAAGADDLNEARIAGAKGTNACKAWQNLSQPTIVAIEGGVVGGALAIVMACDWRIMGRDAYAYVPEVKVGVNFGWGSLPRLTALVGPARAKTMSILCKKHMADECLNWGLADYVVDNGATMDKAIELAQEISALPRLPLQLIKRGINAAATALSSASSFADLEDLLLCLKDDEANDYRAETIKQIKNK